MKYIYICTILVGQAGVACLLQSWSHQAVYAVNIGQTQSLGICCPLASLSI